MPDPHLDESHLRFVLDYLGEELEPSILIGGWATFTRVGGEISRDIDLIIGSPEVRQKVRATVADLSESTHLQGTKWRGNFEGVHVDIYFPHQSKLGDKLQLRTEVLAEQAEPFGPGGWLLLTIEAQTITKMAALLDRPNSDKGDKDAREMIMLLERGVNAEEACRILAASSASPAENLPDYVATAFGYLSDLPGPGKEQRARIRGWRREWQAAINRAVKGGHGSRKPFE